LATANDTLFYEYVESRALRRRLRRLAPAAAAALRDLFRDRDCLVLEGSPETTWRFAPADKVPAPAAIFDGAHEKLALSIADDGWCEMLGTRPWWDFNGEARLLAWALAHTGLLEGLGRILREPLLPTAFADGQLPYSDTTVALEFSASAADGRTTRGCVSLSAEMLARLASHTGWRRMGPTASGWLKLPGTLRVELCDVVFPLAVLSKSEVGDVLILGSRIHCWRKLQVCLIGVQADTRLQTWNASYDGARLTLTSGSLGSPMELLMSDGKAANNIPVSLDFDLGNLAVPLGELAALKPGYVFELPGNLDRLRVAIRANGTRIGHGELVAVGDVLGVQLLSLDVEGLR